MVSFSHANTRIKANGDGGEVHRTAAIHASAHGIQEKKS